jgi:hypothetical protein
MAKDLGRRSHDRRILGESLGKLQRDESEPAILVHLRVGF